MNEEALLEKIADEEYEKNNNRVYSQFKYSPGEVGFGPECCDDCGGDMPLARREYGFSVCVPCKELEDQRSRR